MDRSPGFGSTATNLNRPFKTRFRFGSTYRLNLARNGNSRTHYAKGTQSARTLKCMGLPQLVGKRFQVLFHSPPGVLFAFPSRYWFTIGHQGVFSLGRWSSRIHAGFHVSRATQVPLGVSIVSATGLSPSVELLSKSFAYNLRYHVAVLQPRCTCTSVWASSVSLAATQEITSFSFPPGTEMFHFPGFAVCRLFYSPAHGTDMTRCGLPHSEIAGSQCMCHSPTLIAAYHVLHRLLLPRHPPFALIHLIFFSSPSL